MINNLNQQFEIRGGLSDDRQPATILQVRTDALQPKSTPCFSKGHKAAPGEQDLPHTFVFHRCSDEAGSSGLHGRQCRQEPDTQLSFSTTFEREKDLSYQSHVYSRMSNPTRNLLEETLADLEYGSSCCAFASGNAATSSLITAVGPRTHIVLALTFTMEQGHYLRMFSVSGV